MRENYWEFVHEIKRRNPFSISEPLITFDTNVLLSLYRMSKQTRLEALELFTRLRSRVWLAPQVLLEFYRNRCDYIADALKSICDYKSKVAGVKRGVTDFASPLRERKEIAKIQDALNTAVEELNVVEDEVRSLFTNDIILQSIEKALEGTAGVQPTPEELGRWVSECESRLKAGVPPGYCDKSKPMEYAVGDCLFWKQLMTECAKRKCSAILVTNETKSDWWMVVGDHHKQPHPTLRREFHATTGFGIEFLSFLDFAKSHRVGRGMFDASTMNEFFRVATTSSRLAPYAREHEQAISTGMLASLEQRMGDIDFLEACSNDVDETVRTRAIELLGKACESPFVSELDKERSIGIIARHISMYPYTGSMSVAINQVLRIGRVTQDVLAAFKDLARADDWEMTGANGLESLGVDCSAVAESAIDLLEDPNKIHDCWWIAARVIDSLTRCKPYARAEAKRLLKKFTGDPQRFVAISKIVEGEILDDEFKAWCSGLRGDAALDEEVRRAAEELLASHEKTVRKSNPAHE